MPACGNGGPQGAGGDRFPVPIQSWSLVEETLQIPGLHSQGLASLPAFGPTDFVFTSRFTLDRTREDGIEALNFAFSPELLDLGFDHLGDPDARGTQIYGGLEDNSDPVVNPYHRGFAVFDAETLAIANWANDPGTPDNPSDEDCPWVAVSPDGTWVVTGEWHPMDHVIVYRAATLRSQHTVGPEARIPLDVPFNDVQGCDFDGPRVLVCASDDADAGRLLYAITLSRPLQGETLPPLTARVEPLFPVPLPEMVCGQPQEVEGIDVNGDTLRVLVLGSCVVDSYLYRFQRCLEDCP